MDQRRFSSMMFAVLPLVLFGVLLAGCSGSSSENMPVATGAVVSANTPTVGMDTCARCHQQEASDWMTTLHANAAAGVNSAGSPTLGEVQAGGAACAACHDPLGDSGNVVLVRSLGTIPRPVVGCESCHGPGSAHVNSGGMGPISVLSGTYAPGPSSWNSGTVMVSGQFLLCTSCHELLDTAGTGSAPTPAHGAGGAFVASASGAQFTITDTHFATTGDWTGIGSANTTSITGYAFNYSDQKACTACHNPHKPPTINREWAQSAHGDKGPFNMNSTQTGYFSGAWAHYNWSLSSRMACQRCHTTTGFIAYADALRSGNASMAKILREGTQTAFAAVPSDAQFKPEMLKCNGCHTDNRGALRNPGAITVNYDYVSSGKTYAKASHTYPNVAGSNVCMTCHTARESGETIHGLNDPALLSAGTISAFDYSNMGFINSHYLTAGGQVFTATGYEFSGRPYNNIAEYRHDKIGTPATRQLSPYVNTGSNGPCIGCHMSRPNGNGNHIFLPVSRSSTTYGLVTGIASEVCFNCHGPSSTLILDLVREQKSQFHEALMALEDHLAALGVYFAPYSPYYFIAPGYDPTYNEATANPHCALTSNLPVRNWQTGGTSSFSWNGSSCVSTTVVAGTAGTGQNNLGAAFNFNLLEHDPGAYVHNRMYTKRLIYDSLDWVDDGVMNYSVGKTLSTECAAGSPPAWCQEAITYLLPNGVLGIEAERP